MKRASITKNYLYNVIYQILTLILPLITTPYVSRALGAEAIGIYSYTLSIATYFVLFGSLGVAMYGQREIAYLQNDKKERSKVFFEIIFFRCITMIISIAIYYITYIRGTQYQIYYTILTLELIATVFDISWFFQGLEEFKKTVTRNITVKLISIIMIFVFVKSPENLKEYTFIYAFSTIIGNLSLWLYIPKYVNKINLKKIHIFRHLKSTIGLFIPQIAVQVYTVLDKTMIGTMVTDKKEVGYYDQSQKIIKLLLTLVTSLGTVMLPRMANTFAVGDKTKLIQYMKKSFQFVYFMAFPLVFGILAVSDTFVPIFFGTGYEKVALLMKIISPILLLIGMSNVIGTQYLLSTKRQKEYTISVLVGGIINFCLNIVLIRNLYSIGASIATVIAEIIVTSVQLYVIRKEINIKKVIFDMHNYFFSSIIMFLGVFIIGKTLIHQNIISLIIQIITGVTIYVGYLFLIKDIFISQAINKIKNYIIH